MTSPSDRASSHTSSPEMNETALLMKFIAEVPDHMPNVRVFRRTIINAEVARGGRSFRLKAGIKGQADAYAYVDGGRVVEIETKAAKGRLLEEQHAWRAFCSERRIPHIVLRARIHERPSETVDRWITELRGAIAA
jgi:hypothetical protein